MSLNGTTRFKKFVKFEKRSVRIRVNVRDEFRVKDRVGVRFYYIFEKLFFT